MVFHQINSIIRCHLPLITSSGNFLNIGYPLQEPAPNFSIWNAKILKSFYLEEGFLYYTNVNCLHSVENNSDIDRIHLVIDMKPTPQILKKIYN